MRLRSLRSRKVTHHSQKWISTLCRYLVEALPVPYANPAPLTFFLHQVYTTIRTSHLYEKHRGTLRFIFQNQIRSSGMVSVTLVICGVARNRSVGASDSGMDVSSTCLGAGSLLLATQTRHPPDPSVHCRVHTTSTTQTIMRSNDGFRLKFMNYDLGFRVRILFRVFWETVELRLCVLRPLSSLRVSQYLSLRQQKASTCALSPAGEGARSFLS